MAEGTGVEPARLLHLLE